MRKSGITANATLAVAAAAISLSAALTAAPAALASETDGAINGTFIATSDGVWAKVNDRYEDQPTVVSTWTISSSCPNKVDCTGTVTSDEGWSAPLKKSSTLWLLVRDLPEWKLCPDGTFAHARQLFQFYPIDNTRTVDWDSTTFEGHVQTLGDAGACGKNQSVNIDVPFSMVKAP